MHSSSYSMQSQDNNVFDLSANVARKRGLPYARSESDQPQHHSQARDGVNSSTTFYISGPRPARLFPTPMHEFRKGKYATTGGDRGFMTGELYSSTRFTEDRRH